MLGNSGVPWGRIALLSIIFVGAYFGVRALPVEQCEILHYRDYMTAEGAIEVCGEGESIFFDLQRVRYPIRVLITPVGPVRVGEEARFSLHLANSRGEPIPPEEIAVSHTERIHLMAIDRGLEDYHHVHPVAAGGPGHYQFSLTPAYAGVYAVYLDFIPLRAGRRALARAEIMVEGETPALPPQVRQRTVVEEDGERYTLRFPEGNPRVGVEERITMHAEPIEEGGRVHFAPIMGAFAHLVVFDKEGRGFAHLHPLNPFLDQQDPANPDLVFHFQPDRAGFYRVWAQVHVNGEDRLLPFDLVAEDVPTRRRS